MQQQPGRLCRPLDSDSMRHPLESTMARTFTYHAPDTNMSWEMMYAESQWWARWMTCAKAVPNTWTPVSEDYLNQPWYLSDEGWRVLDEEHELRSLTETQLAFYRLTFDVLPCWENMLTERPSEVDTQWDPTGTYEFEAVGHIMLHHALRGLCNLRSQSGEDCFRTLETHVLYNAGPPAEIHWRAIASLGNIFPSEGRYACASAATVCYKFAQWYDGPSVPSDYGSFEQYHGLRLMLGTRARIQRLRTKVRRCALLGKLKIALRSSELLRRHWSLIVVISNFAA